jgi:hypothetical protein
MGAAWADRWNEPSGLGWEIETAFEFALERHHDYGILSHDRHSKVEFVRQTQGDARFYSNFVLGVASPAPVARI